MIVDEIDVYEREVTNLTWFDGCKKIHLPGYDDYFLPLCKDTGGNNCDPSDWLSINKIANCNECFEIQRESEDEIKHLYDAW